MKNTLLITLEYPPQVGGVANYLANICANLPREQIVVLAPRAPQSYLFDHTQKYKICRRKLLAKNILFWPKWLFLFWHTCKIVKTEKIEKILVGQVLPVGYTALILHKFFKIPYAVFTYGMDITEPMKNQWKKKMVISILKKADKIITIGDYTRNKIIGLGIASDKIIIVHPCSNIQNTKYKIQNNIKEKYNLADKKIILTVGRLVERKGQDKVIEALPKILEKIPDTVYLIVGEGQNLLNLQSKILNLKLENNVILTGKVSDEELASYYELCDIFIMPSREINGDVEGFGIVYLEANSFGKPVIGGRSGGVSDAVIDGQTGLLVDPNNVEETTATVIKLLTDDNLRNKLGEQGRERVEREFKWENEAEKVSRL
jgi:phosphatidylinositol alpha-1,6-mannosyltransferase